MNSELWYSLGTMIAIGIGLVAVSRISSLEKKYAKLVIKNCELEATIWNLKTNIAKHQCRPVLYKGEPVTPSMQFNAQGFEIKREVEE